LIYVIGGYENNDQLFSYSDYDGCARWCPRSDKEGLQDAQELFVRQVSGMILPV